MDLAKLTITILNVSTFYCVVHHLIVKIAFTLLQKFKRVIFKPTTDNLTLAI
jgi:hypothetical protein